MAQVIFDEWKEEYREEGRIEGEERRALKDALNFLKENISVETVSRCTDLPLEKVHELAATLKRD